ncbi:hypothetical protein J5N97_012317 [Dioscorea zingiberensis]|uniref:1-aminocyclopropane-1-carboxylate oxidase n=1 Tax=Dioscorea zingiberensis TaxID=325984 RepID=A0A9D5CNM0_9LILI|nr:hypothetical protein J5N97_012317 [Dioscorea zingiberensis]
MLALCGSSGFVNPWRSDRADRGCHFSLKKSWWWRVGRGGDGGGGVLPSFVGARASLFSSSIGLDSQTFQAQDLSQMLWVGPVPGDIAEVEAYCRIFRAAERLHTVIMETLCSSETGECVVSYDTPSEDISMAEEKVVAVLGCMVALLNRGREDVLSGRTSFMNSFKISDVNVIDGKLPPLAVFRGEMKRCCESLHVALGNYLTPDHESNMAIWRGLHRLKNVCYDAGFSRGDGYPCPTLFANWRPVYFSSMKDSMVLEDSEIAFWRGGQVTDEGLTWLLEKGFKLIVDLRDESVRDEYYQSTIEQAVSSGKIEVLNLPVEVGTAPSKEQVEQFASLVSDSSRRPLYLHSQEGVGRTSAMVSRWRQYTTRSVRHAETNSSLNSKSINNTKVQEDPDLKKIVLPNSQAGKSTDNNHSEFHSVNILHPKHSEEGISATQKECHTEKATYKLDSQNITSGATDNDEVESFSDFSVVSNSLKAQFPVCDIFSKKEMAQFFKERKISPTLYLHAQQKRFELSPSARKKQKVIVRANEAPLGASLSNLMQPGISNGRSTNCISPLRTSIDSNGNANNNSIKRSASPAVSLNGLSLVETTDVAIGTKTLSSSSNSNPTLSSVRGENKIKTEDVSISSAGAGSDLFEGDMCASATGVVRVQSRKKAEMFLVRTDGFSCAREKVTESSLAFTHPSTQQQMLMWKSPPKTVLLLKKLGDELMEEAKEVASFLFYQEKMNVLVEPDVHDIFARIPGFGFVQTFYSQDTSDLHDRVDFVACLGGDGVILHASNLFRGAVPPVVSFNLGSLGFLTSHLFEEYRQDLKAVIHGNNTRDGVYITLRMRLRCEIFRNGKAVPGKVFDVLNEVVVDRGSNPYLSKIECYEHNRLITKVQGDGVIVATPTGSTAYSTAAGGSMVHPNVPCMLFTPICPHSLSFRPVILPDSAQLELKIPEGTRSNAWVSFDGKRRQQLSRGDSVRISMSQHPLPTVNKFDQTVIDFSKLDGDERDIALAEIANGCEKWGFFQLVNHGISTELLERVKKVCSECFKLEREQRFKGSNPVHLLNNLVDQGEQGKRLEDIDWEDVFLLHDDNQWPLNPPEFMETMSEYRKELKKLAEKMMEVMDENLGLEKGYIKKAFFGEEGKPFFGTKVSHYPPCPHPEMVTGLRAHTDAGGVILLFQDDKVGGLQMLKDGEWIDVQPLPNAIVINTGDQIEVLSNGRYKSAWHRVLAKPDGNRRSIASFYNPSLTATIAPAPELVEKNNLSSQERKEDGDDQNIITKYPKFVFGDYMTVYSKQKFLPKEPRFHAVGAM